MAYACALAAWTLIKDDHGLCDQPLLPLRGSGVTLCAQAVGARQSADRVVLSVSPQRDGARPPDSFPCAVRARGRRGWLADQPGLTGFDARCGWWSDRRPGGLAPILQPSDSSGHFVTHPEHGFSQLRILRQMQTPGRRRRQHLYQPGRRFQVRAEDCIGGARRAAPRRHGSHSARVMPLPGRVG